jgi:predicted PurR-regulated permease PerM
MEAAPTNALGRIARASLQLLLIAAAAAVAGFIIIHLRLVVVPVIFALLLSTFLDPLQAVLKRRGVPNGLAAFLTVAIAVGVLALVMTLLAPRVAEELGALGASLQAGLDEVTSWLQGAFGLTAVDVDQAIDDALAAIRDNTGAITERLVRGAIFVGELLAGLLLTLVLVFFLVKDGERIWSWFVDLFPVGQTRVDVNELGRRAWTTLGGYIRGLTVVATVDSVLIGLGLAILGVPLVLPLAALTFVAAYLPLVGAFTAGLVAALVALVAKGWLIALAVVVLIIVVQQVEGDVIHPIVVGRAISLHPVAILLAVAGGAVVAGVLGALLAPPLVAVTWTVFSYLRTLPSRAGPTPGPA